MLLSRVAENIYWSARYLERAESLARMIDATMTIATIRTTMICPPSIMRGPSRKFGCPRAAPRSGMPFRRHGR